MLCVFKHSHLLYEVYCDFPLSIQGIAEAQTGHRLKTKPRFEATIQSDVKAQLKKKKIFCLCWVFMISQGLSLVAESRGYSLVVVRGLLFAVASCGAVAQ